jgi:ABC-type enterochelin transport system permease subunit
MRDVQSPEALEALARRRVKAKLGWYLHATAFALINTVVFAMSVHAFGTRPWSVYPLLGWGLGLVLHGISVFVLGTGSAMHERMVQREREALQRQRDPSDRP